MVQILVLRSILFKQNLSYFQETRVLMSTMPEVFDAVVNCMSKNEMTPKVFCKGCAVLWKLTHLSDAVKVNLAFILTNPINLK